LGYIFLQTHQVTLPEQHNISITALPTKAAFLNEIGIPGSVLKNLLYITYDIASNYGKAACPNLFTELPNLFLIKFISFLLNFADIMYKKLKWKLNI
jgi:hypothetical protein